MVSTREGSSLRAGIKAKGLTRRYQLSRWGPSYPSNFTLFFPVSPTPQITANCGFPRTKEQKENKEGLGMQEQEKTDSYCPSLPHVVTINGFQILLSSIACLPSYSTGRKYLPYSPRPPPSIRASSNQQMTHKTPNPTPYTQGIKAD